MQKKGFIQGQIFSTLTALLLCTPAFAQDLGKRLEPKTRPDGKLAFGIAYFSDDVPDGLSYLLTITPKVSAAEANKLVKVNLFDKKTQHVLKDWSKVNVSYLAVVQVKESEANLVNLLLDAQADATHEVYFVFSEDEGKTIAYNLPVSELCKNYPEYFHNLTNGNRCDQR